MSKILNLQFSFENELHFFVFYAFRLIFRNVEFSGNDEECHRPTTFCKNNAEGAHNLLRIHVYSMLW